MNLKTLVWLMTTLATGHLAAVEIIAHRGASFDAPENTVAAIRLGYEQKADAGELDVYLTVDERVVVLHDPDTARTSGVTNKVAETTLAGLRKLPAGQWGKWKGSAFGERIPSLEEALAVVPNDKRIFIEIKCGPEILPSLSKVLKKSSLRPDQVVIIGFGYDTMREARKMFSDILVLWLVGADKNKDQNEKYAPVAELIAKAKTAKLDGLNLEKGFPMDAAFVREVHEAGLKLYTWTVDDPQVAKRLAAAGIDGITTNRPEWLRQQLEQ